MTDQYILTQPTHVARRFQTRIGVNGKPNYNMHVNTIVPTISRSPSGENEVVMRFFGYIPPWIKPDETGKTVLTTIARSETAHDLPTFRDAFQTSRCLVPADGCYLWDKDKQPYLLRLKSRELFALAGFWTINAHHNPRLNTFSLLTVYPNELVAQIHHRMVVILRPEDEGAYLDPTTPLDQVRQMLVPYPADRMEMFKVTPRPKNTKGNAPKYIQPIEDNPSDQLTLLELMFD